eukprot:13473046-Ditylum_brightwellii.AAC.2
MLLAKGANLWEINTVNYFVVLKDVFLYQFLSVPTNTQFVERGTKETDVVALGHREKTGCSLLVTDCAKTLQEKMHKEREGINKGLDECNKPKQLQETDPQDFERRIMEITKYLTDHSLQFKSKCITMEVNKYKAHADDNPPHNRFGMMEGQTLLFAIQGK